MLCELCDCTSDTSNARVNPCNEHIKMRKKNTISAILMRCTILAKPDSSRPIPFERYSFLARLIAVGYEMALLVGTKRLRSTNNNTRLQRQPQTIPFFAPKFPLNSTALAASRLSYTINTFCFADIFGRAYMHKANFKGQKVVVRCKIYIYIDIRVHFHSKNGWVCVCVHQRITYFSPTFTFWPLQPAEFDWSGLVQR